jgi:hypothetical protein
MPQIVLDQPRVESLIGRELSESDLDFYHKPVKTALRKLTIIYQSVGYSDSEFDKMKNLIERELKRIVKTKETE